MALAGHCLEFAHKSHFFLLIAMPSKDIIKNYKVSVQKWRTLFNIVTSLASIQKKAPLGAFQMLIEMNEKKLKKYDNLKSFLKKRGASFGINAPTDRFFRN